MEWECLGLLKWLRQPMLISFHIYPYVVITLRPISLIYFVIICHFMTIHGVFFSFLRPPYTYIHTRHLFTTLPPVLKQFLAEWVLPLQNCWMQNECVSEFSLEEIIHCVLLSPWFLFNLKQCTKNGVLSGEYCQFPALFIFREIKVRRFYL